jgi:hypothetical protein
LHPDISSPEAKAFEGYSIVENAFSNDYRQEHHQRSIHRITAAKTDSYFDSCTS